MNTEFQYDNQGTNSFLVYPLGDTEQLDTMGIGMISNNHIPHILPVSFTQIDDKRYLRYNISSKIALENFFGGMVNKKRLLDVFLGICEAIEAGDEYMLESSMLVLDKRYIFANVATGQTDLVYLPVFGQEEQLDLCRFFKEIMFSTQFDSGEDCGYVAAIINHLNTNTNFSLKDFKVLLYSLKNQNVAQPVKPQQTAPQMVKPQSVASQTTASQFAAQPAGKPQPITPKPAVQQAVPQAAKPQPVTPQSVRPQATASQPAIPQPIAPKQTVPQPVNSQPAASQTMAQKPPVPQPAAAQTPGGAAPGFAIPGMEEKAPAAPRKLFHFGKKAQAASAPQKVSAPQAASAAGSDKRGVQSSVPGFDRAQAQPVAWAQNTNPAQFGQTSVLSSEIGQTTVLSSGDLGQTTVLGSPNGEPAVPRAVLVQKKNGRRIAVDKMLFRIGTERSFVDCWVSDNSAVSHSHADIVNHDGKYFVRDNNSTNHTYQNGQLLMSNQEYPLADGDQLMFANEKFEFEYK